MKMGHSRSGALALTLLMGAHAAAAATSGAGRVGAAAADVLRAEIDATREQISLAQLRLADQHKARVVRTAAGTSAQQNAKTAHEIYMENAELYSAGSHGRHLAAPASGTVFIIYIF